LPYNMPFPSFAMLKLLQTTTTQRTRQY